MTAPPSPDTQVWLGLGSNLGDKQANLAAALERLETFAEITAVSSLYRTEPVGYLDQDWFLNAAAGLRTVLAPRPFLEALLEVERAMGRVRSIRDGPRLIDLDLLLWENLILDEPGLTVPHPRLAGRHFVLEPLREIAPDLRHPVLGRTIEDLAASLGPAEGVAIWRAEGWPPPVAEKGLPLHPEL